MAPVELRVEEGTHHVTRGGEDDPKYRREVYAEGDTFAVDEGDLGRFEPLLEAGRLSRVDDGAAQDDAAPSDDDEPEPEPEPEADDDGLSVEFVENADYPALRSAAGEFDDVNGNWGEDRLRTELLDRVGG